MLLLVLERQGWNALPLIGAKIVVVDVDKSVEAFSSAGQIVSVVANVSKPEHVESIYRACREHFGRLDILCNNAGVGGVSNFIRGSVL